MKLSVTVFAALVLVFASSPAHAFWPFEDKKADKSDDVLIPAPDTAVAVPDTATPAPSPTPAVPDKLPAFPAFSNKVPAVPSQLPNTKAAITTTSPAVSTAPAAKTVPAFTVPTKPTIPTAPTKPSVAAVTAPAIQTAVPVITKPTPTTDQAQQDALKVARAKADEERIKSEKALADKEKAEADAAKAAAAKKAEEQKKKESVTIQGHLDSKGNFKTLLELLQIAGITTLKSPGNYTIFAPTDAAWEKFSDVKLSDLKKPENIDTLKTLLSYHMLNGNFLLKNIAGRKGAPNALQGDVLNIDATSEPVHVGKAKILETDTGATNGTIYYLDEVLMPPSLAASLKAEKK